MVLGFEAPRHIPIARDDMVRGKPLANGTQPPVTGNSRPPTLYDELPDEDEDDDLDY